MANGLGIGVLLKEVAVFQRCLLTEVSCFMHLYVNLYMSFLCAFLANVSNRVHTVTMLVHLHTSLFALIHPGIKRRGGMRMLPVSKTRSS